MASTTRLWFKRISILRKLSIKSFSSYAWLMKEPKPLLKIKHRHSFWHTFPALFSREGSGWLYMFMSHFCLKRAEISQFILSLKASGDLSVGEGLIESPTSKYFCLELALGSLPYFHLHFDEIVFFMVESAFETHCHRPFCKASKLDGSSAKYVCLSASSET